MKNLAKNILLSLLSLIIFLVIAESLTRLFWNPLEEEPGFRKGLILEGANRRLIYEGVEYQINSYGIRNKELTKIQDPNTIRIMALGDSFIWGDGLKNEDLLNVKLENIFNSKHEKKVEVINAGKCGFNTRDEYDQLLRLYPVYRPEVLIHFFFTNDILATSEKNEIEDWKVVYHMWLKKNSKFYSWLYYIIKITIKSEVGFPKFILPQDYYNLDNTKPGWVNFKRYTSLIKDYCELHNIKYFFVLIPTLTNLDKNYPYWEVNSKVAAFVKSIDIPFLSYFELFSKYKPAELWVSKENTHWNGTATTIAAEELAKFLVQPGGIQ